MLTHQYRSTEGQSGDHYYKSDNRLTEIPTQGPVRLGVFCHIFPTCLSTFKSDIRKHNRRSHVKLHNIVFYFYFYFFKKEKMK